MNLELTKTDHYVQALPIDPETSRIIREACGAMVDFRVGSIEMREKAIKIQQLLSDPEREDKPVVFQRSRGIIVNCPDCFGTRLRQITPENRNDDIEYLTCNTCKGEGQLYQEVIRKLYVPEQYHRQKLAK
jgi:hypothetical protein